MNSRSIIIATIIALVVIVGGLFVLRNKKGTSPTSKSTATQTAPTQTPSVSPSTIASPSAAATNTQSTVTLSQNGFEPATLNVTAGTKVTWTNKSGGLGNISSDPHPIHTLWPFLNLGSFADGASVSVTFDKAGTYTYHNHLSSAQKGTVVVK